MENNGLFASPNFDAQTMMGTLPIQHYVSEALDNHLKGISRIPRKIDNKPYTLTFCKVLKI